MRIAIRFAIAAPQCLLILILGSLNVQVSAQPSIVAKFVARSQTFKGTTIPFRLFIPDSYTPSKRYPIVLALHGSGERGSDNLIQIQSYRLATSWADPVNQMKYPCFVLAPQCPSTGTWQDGSATITPPLATANSILDSLAVEFSIDTNRRYVTGLSMGGFGTWDLITRFPDRFAAAIPMSGGWDASLASAIARVPIWNFHGALDATVPVQWSRDIIEGLRSIGREVIYTHCHNGNCAGLPDSTIAMEVRAHADLFYTEYQNGGHVIWDQSYDYPYLFPWVFDKFKISPGLVSLSNFVSYRTLHGSELITWSASQPTDSVEIQFSPDAGRTWNLVAASLPNTGTYQWNTGAREDCAFGLLKIFLKNSDGRIYSTDQSHFFAIDNGSSALPFVHIANRDGFYGASFAKDTISVAILAGDSKGGQVAVTFWYSADGGNHFEQVDGYTAQHDTAIRIRTLSIGPMPNSDGAVIRVDVRSGENTVSQRTPAFIKKTPRQSGALASHIAGLGGGSVIVNVVNPAALTGSNYRITFDDTSAALKTYDVTNLSTGTKLVHAATQLDGKTEGPQFEGLRLVVFDYPITVVDRVNTKWRASSPSVIGCSVYLPTIFVGPDPVTGKPYPADYRLTFYDHIVDTSIGFFTDYPAIPVKFKLTDLASHARRDFIYVDSDNDRQISNFDEVYILEKDSLGRPLLTWGITFAGTLGQFTLPQPGDEFDLRTLKPLTSKDVFEFLVTSVRLAAPPLAFRLYQNFPNPFNPRTVVSYQLPVASSVKLDVYDVLGREVAVLVNERKAAGTHEVTFDGGGLSSGVYFYRLQARSFSQVRKMSLLK